jgi:hypothetical protein
MERNEEILARQLDAVNRKGMTELAEKFEELYGFKPGKTSARNLRKRIAYRLQEIYYGGISDRDMETLEAVAAKDPLANLQIAGATKVTRREGTRFRRVWKGAEYEVTALGDGTFEFQDKTYRSLSAIAREITGTRWNGKLFFGVK